MASDLCTIPWHAVLVDEAHFLKNPNAEFSRAAARLPTRLRYALTGTPMPNDFKELWWVGGWAVFFSEIVSAGRCS
jgi:SNF2 family DNA or RNA helicase